MFGTKIRMADNSLKEIQDIVIGDVMKEGGKVHATQVGDGTREQWYDVDGIAVTASHAVCKDGTWMRVEDAGYEKTEGADIYYILANQHHKLLTENGQLFTDYQEADYVASGWDDWVIGYLNGDTSVEVLRDAIISTGVESKRAKDFIAKEGLYEEDYNDKKERLLTELAELEEWKKESVLARVKE